MPLQPTHPKITPPTDPDQRVWRYMDFAKFVALISRRELYFCNLEVLAATDPHEGLLSLPNYRHREWDTIADLTPEECKEIIFDEARYRSEEAKRVQFESHKNAREYWLRRRFYDRRTLFVNCWHVNSDESAAMWMQYAGVGYGIAITSSYNRIIAALSSAKEQLFAGMVNCRPHQLDRPCR